MRDVGADTVFEVGAELAAPADERGDDDLTAAVGQHGIPRQILRFRICIREINHSGQWLLLWLNPDALRLHAVQDWPAHPQDARARSLRQERWRKRVTNKFECTDRRPLVPQSKDGR